MSNKKQDHIVDVNKKVTAVEWLIEQIRSEKYIEDIDFEQAKEMEKQQIIDAYNTSFLLRDKPYETADKYYKETYEQ